MFDCLCTLPLSSDIFTQAIHPTEPVVVVGLSSGHVEAFRLPPVVGDLSDEESEAAATASENGYGHIDSSWKTRRHKGSCRTLGFSLDGETIYSSGTDGIVKAASAETGRVFGKIAVPVDARGNTSNGEIDAPSLLHVLSPQTLLLATDSAALHLYDMRVDDRDFKASRPQTTYYPHDDYVSSLTPLPPSEASTSGFSKQWITTGGTTLAVTDLRRGVLVQSEDQEEELLSSVFVGGLGKRGTSRGEKVIVGTAGGILTLWERGVWDDQDERIILDSNQGGESVDCLTLLPKGLTSKPTIAAGMGNGLIALVEIGQNHIVDVLRHDDLEGVIDVGFDHGGRMISAGGQTVKVWTEKTWLDTEDEDEEEPGVAKRTLPGSDDSDNDSDDCDDASEDSEEEEKERKRRKKRKRGGKGLQVTSGAPNMFKGLD
ncbi:WD repeat-containing protein jip5 [Venturia effusa]|uniref:WD repeat-containing protein JIP5 n=1 Tax=Venturia effusa TaxID=50376 RepID=A0A517L0B2_9PEZI|nr:WD repeat-containing protein jip5 [Venturia effusa]